MKYSYKPIQLTLKDKYITALKELDPDYAAEFEEVLGYVSRRLIPGENKVRKLRSEIGIKSYTWDDYPESELKKELMLEVIMNALLVEWLEHIYHHFCDAYRDQYEPEIPFTRLFDKQRYRCFSGVDCLSTFLAEMEIIRYGNANVDVMNRGLKYIEERLPYWEAISKTMN